MWALGLSIGLFSKADKIMKRFLRDLQNFPDWGTLFGVFNVKDIKYLNDASAASSPFTIVYT